MNPQGFEVEMFKTEGVVCQESECVFWGLC